MEGERGRETSVCCCLSHTPCWGPVQPPRRVPWLGIEPATVWFTGWRSVHWIHQPGLIICLKVCLHHSSLIQHAFISCHLTFCTVLGVQAEWWTNRNHVAYILTRWGWEGGGKMDNTNIISKLYIYVLKYRVWRKLNYGKGDGEY